MKREKRKKRLYRDLCFVCFLLVIATILYCLQYYKRQQAAEVQYEKLKADIKIDETESGEVEDIAEEIPEWRITRKINFEALWEENPDIYSWIEIPETKVDYPVLQHAEDDSYYLDHTVEHVKGLPGSIYSEKIHTKEYSSKHTVLYGHNMKNDSMFGSLHDFEDPEFFENHRYIYIFLPEKTKVYEIFAAVKFSDAYLPEYCDYENGEEFLEFVKELKSAPGNVFEKVEITEESKLLTLSTCVANQSENRYLVSAVLIDEYEN